MSPEIVLRTTVIPHRSCPRAADVAASGEHLRQKSHPSCVNRAIEGTIFIHGAPFLRGGGLILVVDDEQIVRDMAEQALEHYGYTVLLAEDGARGLDIFIREADRLRCVVLDLTMPVMSGDETLSRMKAVRTDMPIILSSGFNEIQGKSLAGFLQKPYKALALVEKIKGIISQSNAPKSQDDVIFG